ncbi:MAG TPA: hypothetical protein VFR70_04685 [Flavobacterium sp.]|nr:hypothetical protein [Flavobacterium sp.]
MKQLILSIPTIIDRETRVSWASFKIGFLVCLLAGAVVFLLER